MGERLCFQNIFLTTETAYFAQSFRIPCVVAIVSPDYYYLADTHVVASIKILSMASTMIPKSVWSVVECWEICGMIELHRECACSKSIFPIQGNSSFTTFLILDDLLSFSASSAYCMSKLLCFFHLTSNAVSYFWLLHGGIQPWREWTVALLFISMATAMLSDPA